MFAAALSFLAGNLFLHQFSQLPEWPVPLWLPVLLPLTLKFLPQQPLRVLLWAVAGMLFTLHFAQQRLSEHLPAELAGVDIDIIGTVASIPQQLEGDALRFRFNVEQAHHRGEVITVPPLIRLNWYHNKGHSPQAGEQWQLKVRLKPPHGSLNPGGFDYEKWLFQEGIGALGYIRNSIQNGRLEEAPPYGLSAIRTSIYNRLSQLIEAPDERGVLIALALGERRDISQAQWNRFFNTGTNHLVAISGLHIGLVAALIFLLLRWGWAWLPPPWSNTIASPRVAALCAMVVALAYAALAGFSIPTQRALLMLMIAFGGTILQRPVRPVQLLSFALLMVLLLDPFASLSVGFWLSFTAVAIIFAGMGRQSVESRNGYLIRYGKLQWLLFLGLAPLLVLFFGRVSLIAPIANLIAVPWVSLWVVPLTLLSVVALPLSDGLAQLLITLAATGMAGLTVILSWLDGMAEPLMVVPASDWLLIPAAAGLAQILFCKRWYRSLGLIGIVPVMWLSPAVLEEGEAHFTLLDVGQGLAAVVQTREHTLVFDTGASYQSGFNFGEAVVLPYLRSRNIERIDTLIISHGDNDHIGGARPLSQKMVINRIISSVPEMISWSQADVCRAGERWRWNGVEFELIHPQSHDPGLSENDRSCVLRVTTKDHALLLTGDIERQAEHRIVAEYGDKLRSDIVVAPHHGSKTSSSQPFIDRVKPLWVLFPAGYRNRYHFPEPSVVQRYRKSGAEVLSSYNEGAISFKLCEQCQLIAQRYRQQERHYWHNIEYD